MAATPAGSLGRGLGFRVRFWVKGIGLGFKEVFRVFKARVFKLKRV